MVIFPDDPMLPIQVLGERSRRRGCSEEGSRLGGLLVLGDWKRVLRGAEHGGSSANKVLAL